MRQKAMKTSRNKIKHILFLLSAEISMAPVPEPLQHLVDPIRVALLLVLYDGRRGWFEIVRLVCDGGFALRERREDCQDVRLVQLEVEILRALGYEGHVLQPDSGGEQLQGGHWGCYLQGTGLHRAGREVVNRRRLWWVSRRSVDV